MENIHAHNYRKCQRKEARRYYIYFYLFILYLSSFPPSPSLSLQLQAEIVSFRLLLLSGEGEDTLARPFGLFFFAPLGKLRSEEKSGGSSKFPLETRSCDCDSAIPCGCRRARARIREKFAISANYARMVDN